VDRSQNPRVDHDQIDPVLLGRQHHHVDHGGVVEASDPVGHDGHYRRQPSTSTTTFPRVWPDSIWSNAATAS